MRYAPDGPPRCSLLMCNPLFEERKSAQRVMVEAARDLAAAGCDVLRFDYRGCGDSAGDFADAGCEEWRADIAAAYAWLICRGAGMPAGVLGLRLGAALGLGAAGDLPGLAFAIAWEPVLDGRRYLDQEFRRKLVKEMVTFGQSRLTRATLRKELDEGRSVDLDGYELTPRLAADIAAIDGERLTRNVPARMLLVGVGSAGGLPVDAARLHRSLTAAGAPVDCATVPEDPFWSLVGLVACPRLLAETKAWLCARFPEPGRPCPAPAAAVVMPPPPAPGVPAERPVEFAVGTARVHGILHEPSGRENGPSVIFLHGWAGSRIGPHRMFVHMARRLAARGCACLRFDFRGRGDSDGATSRASIRAMIRDGAAAVDFMVARHPGREVVLLGICSGGKVAVGIASSETRVSGLALWSAEPMGPMRDAAGKARKSAGALRAYAAKLCRAETWRKLLTFRVNLRLVRKAVTAGELASRSELADESRWLRLWRSYRGRVLLVYGTNDPETPAARGGFTSLCREAGIPFELHEIEGANHSFYGLEWERQVLDATEAWIAGPAGGL